MVIQVEHILSLHEQGLHESVRHLVPLLLTLDEFLYLDKADHHVLAARHQLLVVYGNALYEDEQYKRAEAAYSEALKLRRTMASTKSKSVSQINLTSEVEVKYMMHQCFVKLKDVRQAASILEGIAQKQRPPKVNMALAKLYHKSGMERSAITCYKDVLKSSPVALEAAAGLLALGVSLAEVNALVNVSANTSAVPEWLAQYLRGYSFAAAGRHSGAVQIFKSLELQKLHDSVSVIGLLGESFWRSNETSNALSCYERVRKLDPCCLQGMDIYAQILFDEARVSELERLALDLMQVSQVKTEPWVAMAYYCACTNRKTKAIFFAQKAHTADVRNVQALLLKASLLKSLNKQQEAIVDYREAMRLAPNFFQPYRGLAECYVSVEKFKDAINVVRNAIKTVGSNARTLTLFAEVYSQDPANLDKAKNVLQKALSQEPTYLPAVYLLAEILVKEEDFQAAADLLSKQLLRQRSFRLYQMLGDCLKELGNNQEAMEQYSLALRLNPGDLKAADGINSVERDVGGLSDLEISRIGLPPEPRDRSSMEDLVEEASHDIDWLQ